MSEAEKQTRGFWSLITKGSIVIHFIFSAVWLFGVGAGVWLFIGVDLEAPLRPNEVGDFLAGAFSPLAFYWLIVGYWLQRQELQETRKEIQRQANAMTEQTGYLEQELQLRIRLADQASARDRLAALDRDVRRLEDYLRRVLPITFPNGAVVERPRHKNTYWKLALRDEIRRFRDQSAGEGEDQQQTLALQAVHNMKVDFFVARDLWRRVQKEHSAVKSAAGELYKDFVVDFKNIQQFDVLAEIARPIFLEVIQAEAIETLRRSSESGGARSKYF